MIPKRPPRTGQVGFLYLPPWRVQGISVAGEQTMVQVPELDVAFDIGLCPRPALTSPIVALSHGHMDHLGGLPYYFSQRTFNKMPAGRCVCHPAIAEPLASMMESWIPLEQQRTPHEIVPLAPGDQMEVKNNIFLRALEMSHTVPSLGFVLVERRSKLKDEFTDLPQERLKELKMQGVEITRILEVPLVAYTGDTEVCPALLADDFAEARVVISECTFFEADHRSRAKVGKHLHVDDLAALLKVWRAEAVVLVHLSRRTNMSFAKERIRDLCPDDSDDRVHFLMDHRTNLKRYEVQQRQVEAESEAPEGV